MERAVLEPPTLPPECATCGRTFVSWPLLTRHMRLDHEAAADGDVLTVAEILAARPDDDAPPRELPVTSRAQALTASAFAAPPWALALGVWLAALYGLSQLGFSLGPLVAWSIVGAVVLGGLGLHLWARSELKRQEEARRNREEP
jgi:hypothetical protein